MFLSTPWDFPHERIARESDGLETVRGVCVARRPGAAVGLQESVYGWILSVGATSHSIEAGMDSAVLLTFEC